MAYLGFSSDYQATAPTTWGFSGSGADPRSKYRNYLLRIQQMQAAQQQQGQRPSAPARRGGAQPYNGVGTDPMISPTGDALDELYGQAGTADESSPGPFYNPNFRAPGRRLFGARRGYKGALNPGDQMVVGEGGPEVVQVNSPVGLSVLPDQDQLAQQTEMDRYTARRQATTRRLQGSAGIPNLAPQAVDQYESFQRGDQPAYAYNTAANPPSVRSAVMADAAAGRNPYRDRVRSRYQETADANLPQAQADLFRKRRVGESHQDYILRLKGGGISNDEAMRLAELNPDIKPTERTDAEMAAIESRNAASRTQRENAQSIIRQRHADQREAVEMTGSDLPTAIGAVRRYKQNREDRLGLAYAGLDAQVAASTGKGSGQIAKLYGDAYNTAIKGGATPDDAKKYADGAVQGFAGGSQAQDGSSAVSAKARQAGTQASNYIQAIKDTPFVDSDGNFETNLKLAEQSVGELESSDMSPEERRVVARSLLAQITDPKQGWSYSKFPYAVYSDTLSGRTSRRGKLRARIEKMAAGEAAPTKPAASQPARGTSKRGGSTRYDRDVSRPHYGP